MQKYSDISENNSKSQKVIERLVALAQKDEIARRTAASCIGVYFVITSIAVFILDKPRFWIAIPIAFLSTLLFSVFIYTPFNFIRTLGALFAGFYAYTFYTINENINALVALAYFLTLSFLTFKMSARKSTGILILSIGILMYLAYRLNLNAL